MGRSAGMAGSRRGRAASGRSESGRGASERGASNRGASDPGASGRGASGTAAGDATNSAAARMKWSGPVAPWGERGAARHAAFIDAATEVFLEHGYDGATLDEIVRRAGGSRATLNNQFGGKEGLFVAIIATLCAEMNATLALSVNAEHGPRETLLDFGLAFMRVMLRPESLGLYRIVMAEAGRFPALGLAVYRNGPQVAAERLTAYLGAGSKAGLFTRGDAALRARHFLEMIKGDLHFRALLGIDAPSAREIERCVRAAVDALLNGIAARR